MVVEVDSWVLVTAGASVGAAGVTVVVVEVDSWVLVAAGSSALLQPANNAIATKPVAIIVLFFIVMPYYLFWVYLPGIISNEIHANTRKD